MPRPLRHKKIFTSHIGERRERNKMLFTGAVVAVSKGGTRPAAQNSEKSRKRLSVMYAIENCFP